MIVVTGGAGFIGSMLVWKLNELGEKNILIVDQNVKPPPPRHRASGSVLWRKSAADPPFGGENSPKWANISKRSFEKYLESDEFVGRLEKKEFDGKVTALFHMGACSDTTEMDKDFLRKNNSGYSERLAAWAVRNKVYLCYASSAAAYGAGELGYSDEDALTLKLCPLNPYGQSKLDFDIWVLKNGFEKKITGFRFFNVYGPNEYHKGAMRSLVHKGFKQIRETGRIRLFKSYRKEYRDGEQKRDFIYVKDAVDAMIWFYKRPEIKGIYNLGTGKAQSWNELAEALFKAMEKPKNIEYIEMPENIKNQYQYFTQSDNSKLKKTGCPNSFVNLEKGVGDYVHNYLVKGDIYL